MQALVYWPIVAVLVVATFTDVRSRRIPNLLVFAVFRFGNRSFGVAVWLARRGDEFRRRRPGLVALRHSFLDGRHGRRRCKAVRCDWGMDWARPVVDLHWCSPGWWAERWRSAWALFGGFLKELFQHTGDLAFGSKERGEAALKQSAAAQDAVCTGHRDREH